MEEEMEGIKEGGTATAILAISLIYFDYLIWAYLAKHWANKVIQLFFSKYRVKEKGGQRDGRKEGIRENQRK